VSVTEQSYLDICKGSVW